MKTENIIQCPQCEHTFPIAVALTSQLRSKIDAEVRADYNARLAKERESLASELSLAAKAEAARLKAAKLAELETLAAEHEAALQRAKVQFEATRVADQIDRDTFIDEIRDLQDDLAGHAKTVRDLRQTEVILRRDKASLEAARHELEVENARALDAERVRLREELARTEAQNARALDAERVRLREELARMLEAERVRVRQELASAHTEAQRLREVQHAQQSDALRRQVEDLRRKLEAGGEQQRGEAGEVRLEEILRAAFPADTIEAVARGVNGADVRQRICTPGQSSCGSILYENKHTATWNPRWTTKLRDDQRADRADIAVIVTAVLPKQITTFALVDGVWVTSLACLPSLALALRMGLLQLASHRQAAVGRGEKMELVYAYLTGETFKRHVETLVATYEDMGKDLFSEKTALTKMWKRREQQLGRVTASITSFYGDLQTIAGAGTLPEFASLELAGLVLEENAAPSQARLQEPALI